MRAVVQRVTRARVVVGDNVTGEIGVGLLVLLAVGGNDSAETVGPFAEKIANLRIFNDDAGKMNRSLLEIGGAMLAISQFTLYGDARGGRRPSFIQAAPAEKGKALRGFCARRGGLGRARGDWGVSGAHVRGTRE